MDEYKRNKILNNMTTERDLINQFAYARKEGLVLGLEEGRADGIVESKTEIAHRMLKAGMDIQQTAELTQLSVEEAEALKA